MNPVERRETDRQRVLELKGTDKHGARFDITTPIMRARVEKTKAQDGSDREAMILEAPASSTCIDLMGDRMSLACLQSMQLQASQMTAWLNHKYEIPEDVAGTIERAWIVEARDAKQGAVHDMWIRTVLDPQADRAVKTFKMIENGRKFGFSIGGFIKEYSLIDLPGGEFVFQIDDIELFEISVVGIPANQRATMTGSNIARTVSFARSLREAKGGELALLPLETREAQRKALATRSVEAIADEVEAPVTTDEPVAEVVEKAAEPPADVPAAEPVAEVVVPEPESEPSAQPEAEKPAQAPIPAYNSLLLNGEECVLITRAALDEITQKSGAAISQANRAKLTAARTSMKTSLDHGVCKDATASLTKGIEHLDDVLDDNGSDSGDYEAGIRADLAAKRDMVAQLETQISGLFAERDKIAKDNTHVIEAMSKLAAVPLGRVTRSSVGAGAPSATSDPEARSRSVQSVLAELSASLGGRSPDARTRSLSAR